MRQFALLVILLLASATAIHAQTANDLVIGEWIFKKHVLEGDTTNTVSNGVTRRLVFNSNGTYKYILTRKDAIKGTFIETGNWRIANEGKAILFYNRKSQDKRYASYKLPDHSNKLIKLSNSIIVMEEMGVSGQEGTYGISYFYKR